MGRSKNDAIKESGAKKKAPKSRAYTHGSGSEVAETTESSSDDGVVEEEIVEKTKKLKRAEDTIKHLDASIAAQEATNEKRLAELAQTRNNYQSEVPVEVTELYFRNLGSEIQFQYSL